MHANFCEVKIPENYEEAINSSDSKKWRNAMNEEMNNLEEDNPWKEVQDSL